MVAIPLIWSGPRSSGALDRLAAWLERSVARSAAAESVPAGTTRSRGNCIGCEPSEPIEPAPRGEAHRGAGQRVGERKSVRE